MTSRRTEYKGLVMRRWNYRQTYIDYTKEWRALMRHVAKCIKLGGRVTLSTYVVPRRRRGDRNIDYPVHERCDATLHWRDT